MSEPEKPPGPEDAAEPEGQSKPTPAEPKPVAPRTGEPPQTKPIQKPDYVKGTMERRSFLRNIGAAAGILGATSYLALAPKEWPLSLKDSTGLRSKPRFKPVRLNGASGLPTSKMLRVRAFFSTQQNPPPLPGNFSTSCASNCSKTTIPSFRRQPASSFSTGSSRPISA